jgi:polar amino acid transport system substrate-binding protein
VRVVLGLVVLGADPQPVLGPAHAQSAAPGSAKGPPAAPAPETSENRSRLYRSLIRFVTDSDFPPFNYYDDDGALAGFNVDMAKALCQELDVVCDVQARQWKDLIPAIKRGEADAIIASMSITPRLLADVDFTDRYYFTPGRFAARKGTLDKADISPIGLEGKRIAVLRGTAHEAYLNVFFRDCNLLVLDKAEQAQDALREARADLLFDDGAALSFWLNGTNSKACCELRGGPFYEPRYFGDGVGVAVRKGDFELKRLINLAIKRVRESGQYDEIMRKYFPVKIN